MIDAKEMLPDKEDRELIKFALDLFNGKIISVKDPDGKIVYKSS